MDIRLALTVTALDSHGGANRVILKIAEHFDATIYCSLYKPEDTFEEFKNLQIEVPKNISTDSYLGKRFFDTVNPAIHFHNLKLKDYDIINAHQSPTEWIRNNNSPVLWYCYSPYRPAFDLYDWKCDQMGLLKIPFQAWIKTFKYLESRTVPKIEYIFAVSQNTQSRLRKYLKRDSEVLYPAVEPQKFYCRTPDPFFFYPSRIDPIKDFEYAIKAFKIFSSKNKGWKLVIAGSTSDYFKDYLKKVKSYCNDSIILETDISEDHMLDLYSRCHSMLYSPIDEDLGLVPLEGMASSKPVIAKDEGGPKEIISNNIDGFLVNSPAEMAEKMELLANNPELCERMGKAARESVLKRFTWDRFLRRFEEKARELINK